MSERKRPGRPPETRTELARAGEISLMAWAQALLEERRANQGKPVAFPVAPAKPSQRFDADHQRYYFELLAATDSKAAAAAICGFTTTHIDQYAKENPGFARVQALVIGFVKGYRRFRTRGALEERGVHGYNGRPLTDKDGTPICDPETGEIIWHYQYSDACLNKLADIDFREELKPGPAVEVNMQAGVVRMDAKPETKEEFDAKYEGMTSPEIETDVEVKE